PHSKKKLVSSAASTGFTFAGSSTLHGPRLEGPTGRLALATVATRRVCVGRACTRHRERAWGMGGVVVQYARVRSFFFLQAEDGIRDWSVTGVQTCAL